MSRSGRVALGVALLLGLVGTPTAGARTTGGRSARAAANRVLLGARRLSSGVGRIPAGRLQAFRYVAARSGRAAAIHVYLGRGGRARDLRVALYAGGVGTPRALLGAGSLRRPARERWLRIGIAQAAIRRGRSYWIAVLGTGGGLTYRRGSGCRAAVVAGGRWPTVPARWHGARPARCGLAAYVSAAAASSRSGGSSPPTGSSPPSIGSPPSGGSTPPAGGGPGGGSPTPTVPAAGCFPAPGACGLPDPNYHNVGATTACSSLRPVGSITASSAGETVSNVDVSTTITVTAPNVTIDDVCVVSDGGGRLGSFGIRLQGGARNTVIEHSTIMGANTSTQSIDQALSITNAAPATAAADDVENCGECVWGGPWTVSDSYVITNGMQGTTDHFEDVYCSDSTSTLTHDTLLNPAYQTAVLFCDTQYGQGGPCDNHISITNSLLAGGDYVLYTCGNASSAGTSTMTVTGNRFARCTTPPFHDNAGTGGTACRGSSGILVGSGADSHGYWPDGGYFGPIDAEAVYCPPLAGQSWSGNVWDDNGATVACR